MKKSVFILLSFLSIADLFAQSSDTIYYNEDWKVISGKHGASYYRLIEKTGKDSFIVRDYFLASDKLQMEAQMSALEPEEVKNGKATWYFENGHISREGIYVDGIRNGIFTEYYESGQKRIERIFEGKKDFFGQAKIIQVWDPDGNEVLKEGAGRLEIYDPEDNKTQVWIYENYYVIGQGTLEEGEIFTIVEQNASFPGGADAYRDYLRTNMKYPREARKKNLQGKVYVQFVVNKDGSLTEVKVIKGVHPLLDDEAARVIRNCPNWVPGNHKGENVCQRMIIPIVFKLS